MNVVYSFVGQLPPYSVLTVKQLRQFYDGPVYFIVNDLSSKYLQEIRDLDVEIVEFQDVEDKAFTELQKIQYDKFCYCHKLKGREDLFLRAMERFYLLHNLMVLKSLEHVFFVELDNLLYDDPRKWVPSFSKKDMAYMIDNTDLCSSGICYVKHPEVVKKFTEFLTFKVSVADEFLSEMRFLFYFFRDNPDLVQILPTHWESPGIHPVSFENFSSYESIFDALPIGVFLTGADSTHSDGVIQRGFKSKWSMTDFTGYTYVWKLDDKNRKVPFVRVGSADIQINNLHVHSKDLEPFTSWNPLPQT